MITVMINSVAASPGCYVDGHWGQYGPDRLTEIAEAFGWEPTRNRWRDDPRTIRQLAEHSEQLGLADRADLHWERHVDAGDRIEEWLNEHTAPVCPDCHGPMFVTSDGFYRHLGPIECEVTGLRAIDSPWFPHWEWEDGEFFLNIYDGDGEPVDLEAQHG